MDRLKVSIFAMALVLCIGCAQTRQSRFYTLTSISETHQPETMGNDVAIGIGPIKIPDALDRPQMLIRTGPNEFRLAEFDRWAGSFRDNLGETILENLSILLSTDRVFLFPWQGSVQIDYRVDIDVTRFDGEPGGSATLAAQWSVTKEDRKEVVIVKRSTVTEPAEGKDYAGLVAAESRALAKLSRDIADGIKGLWDHGSSQP